MNENEIELTNKISLRIKEAQLTRLLALADYLKIAAVLKPQEPIMDVILKDLEFIKKLKELSS